MGDLLEGLKRVRREEEEEEREKEKCIHSHHQSHVIGWGKGKEKKEDGEEMKDDSEELSVKIE